MAHILCAGLGCGYLGSVVIAHPIEHPWIRVVMVSDFEFDQHAATELVGTSFEALLPETRSTGESC